MARYLLIVDFQSGPDESPMSEWTDDEVAAHLDYYGRLNAELAANGELVGGEVLTGPDLAKIVRSDGVTPVITDGPFQEFKEWVAGYQIVDVESEERALEIAGLVSAVPGRGGVPTQQPIQVRRIMDDGPSGVEEMNAYLETASTPR
ncbi:YciI family protein [Cellulomonas terrae]|uniref:Sigma associated protein n=1 Tax=Cellulomonas terrae TaxID=311234 RepID=A0A511JMY8_9CELL|nr:YciI family protein [Cellulomonas terrae]GEL99299.1 sigma associated protein [Cellulomonas terrae]